jgi:hypothetical protein
VTLDERRDYEARLAAANQIIADQNRAIAALRAALVEPPATQFLVAALLRDRRAECR